MSKHKFGQLELKMLPEIWHQELLKILCSLFNAIKYQIMR